MTRKSRVSSCFRVAAGQEISQMCSSQLSSERARAGGAHQGNYRERVARREQGLTISRILMVEVWKEEEREASTGA